MTSDARQRLAANLIWAAWGTEDPGPNAPWQDLQLTTVDLSDIWRGTQGDQSGRARSECSQVAGSVLQIEF